MPAPEEAIVDTMRQRLFSGLHLGILTPGARLPSARALAAEFGAGRRAVLAAYQALEREGLVTLRPRSGIYVAAPGALGAAGTDAFSRRARRVVQFLLEEIAEGTPATRVPDRLLQLVDTVRLRAAVVECNDDQIASLAAELRADYGFEVSGVELHALAAGAGTGAPPPEVRRAHVVVTTPFHAGAVKEAAERIGKPWLAVATRTDMPAAIARLLLGGPVYIVVADPRFADKLGRLFAASPGAANLHPLVVGRDAVEGIPAGVPVYVTDLARARLGAAPLAARGTPEPRALAPRSATELLTFIVRANLAAMPGVTAPNPGGDVTAQ